MAQNFLRLTAVYIDNENNSPNRQVAEISLSESFDGAQDERTI